MSVPVTIDVPHQLGRAGARARLKSRIGELGGHIPGGVADIQSSWPSEDEMALEIKAMGQTVPVRLEVLDTLVRVHISLPAMLAYFTGLISAAVRDQGTKLLR
ncbi:polyhydroxyalkanoic acid system family protein [Sphingomonas sp. ASY06-1R]|uniref:polyhydroxyalkanoic acid system family protein n=1 Tax=Sphingomonas sp. ASY06-1R TaxID=3445771 RepID=UPI003FA319C9